MPEGSRETEHERELWEEKLAAVRTEFQLQLNAAQRALEIQAREYERRLEALNHAHAEARQKEAVFLDRTTYNMVHQALADRVAKLELGTADFVARDRLDASLRQVGARFDEISNRIAAIERARANLDGRITMLGSVLLGVSFVLNLLMTLIAHFIGR